MNKMKSIIWNDINSNLSNFFVLLIFIPIYYLNKYLGGLVLYIAIASFYKDIIRNDIRSGFDKFSACLPIKNSEFYLARIGSVALYGAVCLIGFLWPTSINLLFKGENISENFRIVISNINVFLISMILVSIVNYFIVKDVLKSHKFLAKNALLINLIYYLVQPILIIILLNIKGGFLLGSWYISIINLSILVLLLLIFSKNL